MTKTFRHLLGGTLVLLLVGCNPMFQDEAWEKVCAGLKAPSTAKVAAFKTYAVSDDQRKALYLLTLTEIHFPFSIRKDLATTGSTSLFSLGVTLERLPKEERAALLTNLRAAAPSQGKALDDCDTKKVTDLTSQSFSPSKREIPACIKVIEDFIRVTAARELAKFNAFSTTVEARTIFIDYDAANSYGAMLRGTAHFYGVSVGSSRTILDTDVAFDFGLAGLPAGKLP